MTTPTLTHEHATFLRAVKQGEVAGHEINDLGESALAKYDADQAAMRAAEIEAAFREGFAAAADEFSKPQHEDLAWNESVAKKALEAK